MGAKAGNQDSPSAHEPSLLLQGEAWGAVQCVGALYLGELIWHTHTPAKSLHR